MRESGWDPIVVSGSVQTLVSLRAAGPVARISGFDISKLANVDLPRLVEGLDLTEADRNLDLGWEPPATRENRLLVTRQALADFKLGGTAQDH